MPDPRRRQFIRLLGGAATAWPLATRAQSREQVRMIGVLMNFPSGDDEGQARVTAFAQALQKLGWIEMHALTSVGPRTMSIAVADTPKKCWR
jgi:hypothetical protein